MNGDAGSGSAPATLAEDRADPERALAARHAKTDEGLVGHGRRFTAFSLIGVVVLALGIGVQAVLERMHLGHYVSYCGQAVFSIELSFLLNHTITWRHRGHSPRAAFVRFNIQKFALTVPNLLIYALLLRVPGVTWLIANLGTTVIFTIVNYVGGDLWAFQGLNAPVRERTRLGRPVPAISGPPPTLSDMEVLPTVSVIIPCKRSERTIRATVEALLGQDYPELVEVILVGDVDDSTWAALQDITDPRLVMLEQEQTPGHRDPNIKRAKGIRNAIGDVLALADSDIVMDPDWLSRGIRLLGLQGDGLVAGGMRTIKDSFWGRFVDRNALAAKTPRIPQPYNVTAANFGKRGFKPPITANAIFTRELYENCALDTRWAYGYEDYEWFWRVSKNGHWILYSNDLTAAHHHRSSFRALLREYRQSARGCARFILVHRDSPLARKRLRQAALLPLAGLAALAGLGLAVADGYRLYALAAVVAACLTLSVREAIASRKLEAAIYPPFSLVLGVVFTLNLGLNLVMMPVRDPSLRGADVQTFRKHRWALATVAVLLALGTLARLWDIGSRPEWQLDEITYWSIGRELVQNGTLNVPLAFQQVWQPFLYHPPFYMFLLASWYRLVGIGITQSRVLGVIGEMLAFALLARLLTRLYGARAATFATALIVFDGWLLYVGRISYIEDTCLLIMMIALSLYAWAVRTGGMLGYILAGAAMGCAAIFNQDAAYLIGVIAIHWLLVRRDGRQHLAALAAAALVCAGYVAAMVRIYTIDGTDWWWHDTLVQILRLTGGQSSAGTLSNPRQFIALLGQQYDLFIPSVIVAAAGIVLLLVRLVACARRRNLSPLGEDKLLPAWCITAVGIFGPAGLHFSQYFVMVLLPIYAYLWVSLWPRLARRPAVLVAAFSAIVIALGCGSAVLRLRQDSNAFREFQQYAATKIPPGDLVIAGTAGDPIAYVINQPWCSPGSDLSSFCFKNASYLVTWQTYLQSANPLHLEKLAILLRESRVVAEFHQFSGTITVRKIDRSS